MFELNTIEPANKHWTAQKVIINGIQGLGKSTFACTFEKPILVRTEDGAGALNVPTFPDLVKEFSHMKTVIEELHKSSKFKTCVIDSIDWLEPIVFKKQIEFEPKSEKGKEIKTIEDYGFGKGYTKVLDWWRYIMGGLDSLRLNKGMNIVLVAHTEIKRHEPPDSDPYDRYQIKLHKHASSLWQEWADMVLFANYKTSICRTDTGFNKTKTRGVGDGERVLYTETRPAYLAKNRWGLPPEIYIGQDKTWGSFHKALAESTNGRYVIPATINDNIDNL